MEVEPTVASQHPRRRRWAQRHQRQTRTKKREEEDLECHSEDSDANIPPLAQRGKVVDSSSDEDCALDEEAAPTDTERWPGLQPPRLKTGGAVDMAATNGSCSEQMQQQEFTYWSSHQGEFVIPPELDHLGQWRGEMSPKGLALHHPATGRLLQYATKGCPSRMGNRGRGKKHRRQLIKGLTFHIGAGCNGTTG